MKKYQIVGLPRLFQDGGEPKRGTEENPQNIEEVRIEANPEKEGKEKYSKEAKQLARKMRRSDIYESILDNRENPAMTAEEYQEAFDRVPKYKDLTMNQLADFFKNKDEYRKRAKEYIDYKNKQSELFEKYTKPDGTVDTSKISTTNWARLYDQWNLGDIDPQTRRGYDPKAARKKWGSSKDWKEFTNMVNKVAVGAPLAGTLGGAGTEMITLGTTALANPYVQAGLTGYGFYDGYTNTGPATIQALKDGRGWDAAKQGAYTALNFLPAAVIGPKLLKGARREFMYNAINPFEYGIKNKIKAMPGELYRNITNPAGRPARVFSKSGYYTDEAENIAAGKRRLDAWGTYLGKPQKYDTFKKHSDGTYSLNDEFINVPKAGNTKFQPRVQNEIAADVHLYEVDKLLKAGKIDEATSLKLRAKIYDLRNYNPDSNLLGHNEMMSILKGKNKKIYNNLKFDKQQRIVKPSTDPNYDYTVFDVDKYGVRGGFSYNVKVPKNNIVETTLSGRPKSLPNKGSISQPSNINKTNTTEYGNEYIIESNDRWDLMPFQKESGKTYMFQTGTNKKKGLLENFEIGKLIGGKPFDIRKKQTFDLNLNKVPNKFLDVPIDVSSFVKRRFDKGGSFFEANLSKEEADKYRAGGYILEELQDGGYPGGIDRELYQYEEGRKTLDQLSPEAKKIAIANNKKNYKNNPDPFAFTKMQFEFDKKQSDKNLKKIKEQSKNLLNTSSSGNKFGLNDKFKFKGFDTRSEEQKRIDEENFQKSVQDSSASTQDGYSLPISLIDGSKEDLANFMYDTPRELTANEKSKALSWISGQPQNKELSNDDIYQLMEGQAKYLNIPKKSDEQIVQEYYNEVAKNPNYLKRNFGKPGPSIHIPYEAMKRLEEKKKKELEDYEVTDASPGRFDDHIEFAKEMTINPIKRTYNKLTTDPIGFGKDIGTTYSDLVTSPITAGKELYDYVAGDGNFEFDKIIDMDALGTTLDVVGSIPTLGAFTKAVKPVTKLVPAVTKGVSKARKAIKNARKPYYQKVVDSEGMVDLNGKLYITDKKYKKWLKQFPDYSNEQTQVSKMLQKVDSGEIGVLQKKPVNLSVREDELMLPPKKFKIVDEQVKLKLDRMKSEKGFNLIKEQEKAYLNKTLNKDGKLTAKEVDEMSEAAANARIDEVENLYNTKNYSADIEMQAWHRRSPDLENLYDKSGQYVANINKTFSPANKEVVLGFNPNYVTRKNPAVIQHELGHMASAGRDIPIEKELIEAVGKPNVYKNIPKGEKYNHGAWRAYNYFVKKEKQSEKLVETLRKLDPVENQSLTKGQLFDKYKNYRDVDFPYLVGDIRVNTLKSGEPIPFAQELKQTMIDQGLMKDWFTPITEDMLRQSQKLSKQKPRGYFQKSIDGGKLDKYGNVHTTTRLLDFTDPSRYKQLAKVLNKVAPIVATPIVATSMLDNKREGGQFIEMELDEDELQKMIEGGYRIEEID